MASSSTNLSRPSSSSTHRWTYDVFLCFRGKDTRQSFTAHLYAALCQEGIRTFKDNNLMRGRAYKPFFYNVDPSHVRKQKGSFAEALAKHEEVYGKKTEKVVKWRKALTKAATISGWESRNRDDSEIIEEIVTRILNECIAASSSNMDAPVGNANEYPTCNLGPGGTNFGIMIGEKCFNMGPNHGNIQF